MNQLDYFKRFIPKEAAVEKKDLFVWIYTRVSSKEQYDNNSSVENQLAENRAYAARLSYRITEEFGGTYESAKSDFTRKEFRRLITKVESSRRKPYAILVYKMSRFSRSGGNAIGLVNRLVEELGVHLIEVSTGLTTNTERGKADIYESLFHAYKENLEKKEIVIPSMKAWMKKGYWLGVSTIGYDHYGPKVRREQFFSKHQKFVINKEGELLKEAWKWKASGHYSDAQIINKLAARGLKLLPQKLSKIWRNPFYCGILINRLIDEPVKGNWEPLVNMQDFIKVQQVLEGNHSGYEHNKGVNDRPLLRFLRCNNCGSHLVGYLVHKKNLHYYRCLKCPGVSLNATTTQRSRRKGASDLFLDLLNMLSIPQTSIPLILLQLNKMFDHYQKGTSESDQLLESRAKELEKKKKELTIRHGLGEIDRATYELTLEHLTDQMESVYKELNMIPKKISNLENLLKKSLKKLANICSMWTSGSLDCKRKIQKTLFPEGVFYDAKNHKYLTKKINGFLLVTIRLSNEYGLNKKGDSQFFLENLRNVARTRIELVIHP